MKESVLSFAKICVFDQIQFFYIFFFKKNVPICFAGLLRPLRDVRCAAEVAGLPARDDALPVAVQRLCESAVSFK